jgi:hypothetical protein
MQREGEQVSDRRSRDSKDTCTRGCSMTSNPIRPSWRV